MLTIYIVDTNYTQGANVCRVDIVGFNLSDLPKLQRIFIFNFIIFMASCG